MQSYNLPQEQIMKFLNLSEKTYLNIVNLIKDYPEYTVAELADEYLKITGSSGDANCYNDSDKGMHEAVRKNCKDEIIY